MKQTSDFLSLHLQVPHQVVGSPQGVPTLQHARPSAGAAPQQARPPRSPAGAPTRGSKHRIASPAKPILLAHLIAYRTRAEIPVPSNMLLAASEDLRGFPLSHEELPGCPWRRERLDAGTMDAPVARCPPAQREGPRGSVWAHIFSKRALYKQVHPSRHLGLASDRVMHKPKAV